jgi:fluoroquinolone transport system permease protein
MKANMKATWNAIWKAFGIFIAEIRHDFMLTACLFTPVLMGIVYKLVIPLLEEFLITRFTISLSLAPYYLLLDLLLLILTSVMFAFSGTMVMLGELDNGTAKYLMITPLGKKGYLLSRIGIPMVISIFYGTLALVVFKLSKITPIMIVICALLSGIISLVISLLVISLAKNKLEGMALTKLSGFIILGLPVAIFITSPFGYMAGILPSFWVAKLAISGNVLFIVPYIIITLLWIRVLYGRFKVKLF